MSSVRRALCNEFSQYRDISGLSSNRPVLRGRRHGALVLGDKLQPRAAGIVLFDQEINGRLTTYTVVADEILRQLFRHVGMIDLDGVGHGRP